MGKADLPQRRTKAFTGCRSGEKRFGILYLQRMQFFSCNA